MKPDPKWLEVFKDDNLQLAFALACGLFLGVNHWEHFTVPDWVVPLVSFGFILFGCLFLVSLISAALKARS